MNEPYHTFKIVVVGKSGTGKTSIIYRIAEDKFKEGYGPTVGVDFKFKYITLADSKTIKLQMVS